MTKKLTPADVLEEWIPVLEEIASECAALDYPAAKADAKIISGCVLELTMSKLMIRLNAPLEAYGLTESGQNELPF